MHAVVAVQLHDLVQARLGGVAHQLQTRTGHLTIAVADELQMHRHFITEQLIHLARLLDMPAGDEIGLNVGEALVHFQRVQRGVVPGVFSQGAIAFFHFNGGLAKRYLALHARGHFLQAGLAELGRQHQHRVRGGRHCAGQPGRGLHQHGGDRRGNQGHTFFHDARRVRQRIAKIERGIE